MTTRTKTVPAAKKAARPAAKKAAATSTRKPKVEMTPRAVAEELRVQADLAGMEARDQWRAVALELDRRRRAADLAVRELIDGGTEATRTLVEGVRGAVEELRLAVEKAVMTLR